MKRQMTSTGLTEADSTPTTGNYPARVFRALHGAWNQDASGERVDQLAAELAACAAACQGVICLGLVRKEAVPSFFGLVYLLDGYGLLLRKRYRSDGATAFVYLSVSEGAPSEFAGTVVRELARPERLATAA